MNHGLGTESKTRGKENLGTSIDLYGLEKRYTECM